jgi:ribonuclease HI
MTNKLPKVEIYSDGWARPNPGPWGYGVILRFKWQEKELSGFENSTTNNRMELTWVIVWLLELKEKCNVEVFTDSSYVVNWIELGRAKKWRKNNWMRTKSEKAINYDLWEKLLKQVEKHDVKLNWVRWHSGHEENERCDSLATEEILKNSPNLVFSKGKEVAKNKLNKQELLKKVLNTWIDNGQKKVKIEKQWDKCRKCWTPVEKKLPKKKNTKNKSYYYEYYLSCSNCLTNYFVDDAKVMINKLDI